MSRTTGAIALAILAFVTLATTGAAQDNGFSALARIDAEASEIRDAGRSDVAMDLYLSQGVPYRVFTLDAPRRLVLDFQEVDWSGMDANRLRTGSRIADVRVGTYRPGWSRMVLHLTKPMEVTRADLAIDPVTSAARLSVLLEPQSEAAFAASAGAPGDPRWDLPPLAVAPQSPEPAADVLRVVLDPGHGGVDPGAERQAANEKELMLTFARELEEILLRTGGYEVILTREGDYFVSLERRIAIANEVGADLFISLHADALAEGQAHGATVHMLSRDASDLASAKLAERHDRDDLLSGADLATADDEVTRLLLDLARRETQPRTEALAESLVDGMAQTGGPMNRRPLRSAAFSVLKAADIPSVLIEIGFLSSPRDYDNLTTREWRLGMAAGIRNGLEAWRKTDAARRSLVRQ